MTPTTRNTLIVGIGLIVAALLLTCGPMRGLFGAGDGELNTAEVDSAPPEVAADPKGEIGDPADAALAEIPAVGAGVEAASGDGSAEDARAASDPAVAGPPLAAGVGQGIAGTVGEAGAPVPEIPAPVEVVAKPVRTPSVEPASPPTVSAEGPQDASPEAALAAFDEAFATGDGLDALEGPAVARFAPPVAAEAPAAIALNVADRLMGLDVGGVRQPCDQPGSGCRNISLPPPVGPTIRPGGRPR
jgi:hypothetical protein